MNKLIRKFISIFILLVFSIASGPGQLIHAAFHDRNHSIESNAGAITLSVPHTLCIALQLTLPEFFEAGTYHLQSITIPEDPFFEELQPAIPHLFLLKHSDRAPPVQA